MTNSQNTADKIGVFSKQLQAMPDWVKLRFRKFCDLALQSVAINT